MLIQKRKINPNILIGTLLLFSIAVLNPYTWIIFFDSDGFLLLSRKLILFTFDFICALLAYYFFKNKNNNEASKLIFQILIFNIALLIFGLFLLHLLFGDCDSTFQFIPFRF